MVILEILNEEHRPYLIYNNLGIISGVTEDAPEKTKKAYQELVDHNKYCEENEIDI